MAAFNKFHQTVEDVYNKKHDFGADTFFIALTNTQTVATNSVLADITQIANGNGYATDGKQVTITSAVQTAGVLNVVPAADVVWTGVTADMAAFQYAVLYNQTTATNMLVSWYERPSALILSPADTFTVDVQAQLFTAS